MTAIDEMDEFVNWNDAAPAIGDASASLQHNHLNIDNTDPNLNLALENASGDDFSFWALEHFDTHSSGFGVDNTMQLSQPLDNGSLPVEEFWETPQAPCDHCKLGGYQCKTIPEGKYKGYCTSCVALRCQCSLGPQTSNSPAAGGSTFPPNPWPILGDHPNSIANEELDILHTTSGPDLTSLGATSTPIDPSPKLVTAPKIGARFSRESVKILKNWLSTHSRHPYPTDEEKEGLQRQTGLNKTQITNWLANARRRGKIQAPRSTSPHPRSTWAGAIDIPRRRGTPIPFETMGPLERWVDSPPENEPATVFDIARAVRASSSGSLVSSGINSPYSGNDDKSLYNGSSASSLGTSHSSTNSFASHGSRGSMGSFGSFNNRGRRRRRRRQAPKHPEDKTPLTAPLKTYQCTFCTDTFRTKHDWQRHEKSLHLSLERWVCAPSGPRVPNESTGVMCCVFCGIENPDDAHIDSHNYCACQERTLDERTFYRKDHLRQHLKLVHNVKFLASTMEPWKVATPEIRSRCGFCGIIMDSWTFRVDHIAEHFKTGYSMADWKGDWGFDAPVMEMVENSIPPFLIHDERNSPLPFVADGTPPESPRNAYEMLKVELAYLIRCRVQDSGRTPTDNELRHEAMRIIYGSEVLSRGGIASVPSWLRDLLFSDAELAEKARMERVRSAAENRLGSLLINGKNNLFDDCPLEQQLNEFVKAKRLLGLTAMDDELQEEACGIIGRMEESSNNPQDEVANWLLRLIKSSPEWLAPFRQRASLPRSEDIGEGQRSKDPKTIDSTIHNYSRLETELAEYVKAQRSQGREPTDGDLQRQARLIIYEFDDAWNQTAADNEQWLFAFRQRHLSPQAQVDVSGINSPLAIDSMQFCTAPTPLGLTTATNPSCGSVSSPNASVKLGPFFFNDVNCYRRLARELARWVASVMSPNNPNCHTPTDREIQHQARWILYDDDDPWNQTAADNEEWLRRFKRDVGLLNDGGEGLPETEAWAIKLGGSGFAPPYAFPKPEVPVAAPFADITENHKVHIRLKDGCKPLEAEASTANKFLQTFTSRFEPLPKVFCPRELEKGLADFVQTEIALGRAFPSDEMLRAQARLILGTETTSADDAVLLEKFKDLARGSTPAGMLSASPSVASMPTGTGAATVSPTRASPTPDHDAEMTGLSHLDPDEPIRVNMTESELDNLLKDMNFEFGDPDIAASTAMGLDFSPGNFC